MTSQPDAKHADADPTPTNQVTVDRLDNASVGRWLVTCLSGSRHIWDLDARTYRRLRGSGQPKFPADGQVVKITRVERWPQVGACSFIWFNDPDDPLLEQWRGSSSILSIELLAPGETPSDAPDVA